MTARQPSQTINLDIYANAALPWTGVLDTLAAPPPTENLTWFLGTVGGDFQPHAADVGARYIDGDVYVVSGPRTRKSRNLAANPTCTVAVRLKWIDLVFMGEALRVTDSATLEAVAAKYREGGWPVAVDGDAFTAPFSAPSAGRPPWYLYRFTFDTVVGVAGEEPNGATRWRFGA